MRTNAAIAIVFTDDQTKVLLVQRQDVPVWVLPGGGIDRGETAEIAVLRELKEETGLEADILRKVAEYTPINKLSKYTETFECKVKAGKLISSDETKDLQFFPIDQLPKHLFFLHKNWITDALKNDSKVIHKSLTEVSYLNLCLFFITHPIWVLRFLTTLFFKSS